MAGTEKLNEVQKTAIHRETVTKENRHELLPPVLTDKPMSTKPTEESAENSEMLEAFRKAGLPPTEKYSMPQTSSQEIGWWVSTPLIPPGPNDKMFNYHRCSTDVTK